MDRADRHHEAQAVRGCHVAPTPGMGKRNTSLGGDQDGIGLGERFRTNVVLPNPAQPRAAQRWRVTPDQRLESSVAGFGQQHGTDAGRDVASACAALAGMGELGGEPGAGVHLQQQLGQVHPGQPGGNGRLERGQAGRLLQLVQGGQDQVAAVHLHTGISRQVCRGVPVGSVQPPSQARDLGRRVGRKAQGAADGGPCRLPCLPRQ